MQLQIDSTIISQLSKEIRDAIWNILSQNNIANTMEIHIALDFADVDIRNKIIEKAIKV